MTEALVQAAYSSRAAEYIARFGDVESAHPADRQLIAKWAGAVVGPVLDVGCGPGHWTKFLADRGAVVEGIDLVPAFIEQAKVRFPGIPFRVASLTSLGAPAGAAAGILAWYSLIHLEPNEVPPVLQELARSLTSGGDLLVGLFESPEIQRFSHAITPAYSWPVKGVTKLLESTGFETVSIERRTGTGHRPHAAISARLA
ncbi:class I SAM-dependent methyltransferase [Arthrobacter sp. BB-1]|uniref:class I SAM-dependent DNA methyltransferase n=1 Tax=unclassified Arthrobacter TaxID=235627 RepID=UPI0010E60655|nr:MULTISPECIES: class I SAM-dependent methyltransferase [unclassified Arthrobacter]TNB72359.1 class I SAM-dependent methyltransferase [Arthrobacter sp. BB-1]VII95963.1 hypothetical protein [Arthrobacter sp. DR-2P]